MRYLELELESARPLTGIDPPLQDVLAFAMPADDVWVVCDRPDGATARIVRFDPKGPPRTIALDEPGFFPRLLADAPDGRILVVGAGTEHNALLVAPEGAIERKYHLGEEIADIGFDPDGNLVVLRMNRKNRRTLLDRYGIDGDRVVRDDQIERITGHSSALTGSMLLIQQDGSLWLNLSEKYNVDGELLDVIDPAELFGAGRVSSDLIGWEGIVVLSSAGVMAALLPRGERRTLRLPDAAIQKELGRRLTARHDVIATRGERLFLLATDTGKALAFRILSE